MYCAKVPNTLILSMFVTVVQRKERGSNMMYMYINQRCKKIYECFMFRIFAVYLKDGGWMEEKREVQFCTISSIWVCFEHYGHLFRHKCLLFIRWARELNGKQLIYHGYGYQIRSKHTKIYQKIKKNINKCNWGCNSKPY